ncbi:MAG: nuclear transport factor 2 family protein [Chloroflexota bacterium]
MTEIVAPPNSDNAPRKQFLLDYNIAFVRGDFDFVLAHAHDDFVWRIVGESTVTGKAAFEAKLREMPTDPAQHLEVETIITHGRTASINGTITDAVGTRYGFCDVVQFVNTKHNIIKSLTSYVIPLGDEANA